MSPEVTVVIPTHNRLPMLKEAVTSVLDQTFRDLELIVVDDGSSDGTWTWLERQPQLRSFRIAQRSERSAARNRGLQNASAPMILFLDDDDLLTADALDVLVAALREHSDAVAAVGAFVEFDASGNRRRHHHPRRATLRWAWPDAIFDWRANPGRTLFRTDLVRSLGGFASDLSGNEDLDLWLRVAERGPAAFVPTVVLEARLHGGQTEFADARRSFDEIVSRHIATLNDERRSIAERMQRIRSSFLDANDALSEPDAGLALRRLVGLTVADPGVLGVPIVRRPLLRSFVMTLVGTITGPRGLSGARRLTGRIRRLARTDAWRNTGDRQT